MFSLPLTFPLIIVFAIIGLLWGWLRMLYFMAFAGVGLLFFSLLNGGTGLAYFLCVKGPAIVADALGQHPPTFCDPSSPVIGQIFTLGGFTLLSIIGFLVGGKLASGKPSPAGRLMGAFLGLLTGLMVTFFLYNFVSKNQGGNQFLAFLVTSNPMSYIPVILVIGGALGFIAIIVKSLKKSGGGATGAHKH